MQALSDDLRLGPPRGGTQNLLAAVERRTRFPKVAALVGERVREQSIGMCASSRDDERAEHAMWGSGERAKRASKAASCCHALLRACS